MYSFGRVIDLTIYKSGNILRMLGADCAYGQSALRMCSFHMPFFHIFILSVWWYDFSVVRIRTTCFADIWFTNKYISKLTEDHAPVKIKGHLPYVTWRLICGHKLRSCIIYLSAIHHLNCKFSENLIQNTTSNWRFLNPYQYPLKRGWVPKHAARNIINYV